MNIAQTAHENTEVRSITTSIYINMDFAKLANDINSKTLAHQFNGKGRRMALLTKAQEPSYLNYSSDSAGINIITPPFDINNGDNIKFTLQAAPKNTSNTSFKWKGIIQNRFDLHLVPKTKSTYNANVSSGVTETSDIDKVSINVNFKFNGDKFSVAWDPAVRIRK